MNILPRKIIFAIHIAIVVAFVLTHWTRYEMLLALIYHYYVLENDSSCYPKHCRLPSTLNLFNYQTDICLEESCQRPKWMRMKHCYKCRRCIHKYDHHCVLMDICIGEFNHRYYLLFLICFLWNIIVLLVIFTREMKEQVQINQMGVEHFSFKYYLYGISLLAIYFNLILTFYLVMHHIYFTCNNTTTWEYYKRDSIPYLKNLDSNCQKHPFSKGTCQNYRQLFSVNKQEPINWSKQMFVEPPHQQF